MLTTPAGTVKVCTSPVNANVVEPVGGTDCAAAGGGATIESAIAGSIAAARPRLSNHRRVGADPIAARLDGQLEQVHARQLASVISTTASAWARPAPRARAPQSPPDSWRRHTAATRVPPSG